MSAYRLLGDAFSPYFFDRVLFDDPKFANAFRFDSERVREVQRLVRDARKLLAHRATAQSTEMQLLRPLAALAGWEVANDSEPIETMHGNEDGGLAVIAADGTTWARAFCAAPSDDLDATPRGRHRRFALQSSVGRVLEATSTPYALALNRSELRLVRRPEGGTFSAIVFNLDALAEWGGESERAWRLLLGLTAAPAVTAPLLLERIVERGRREMIGVGNRLGRQVLEAVDLLARSFYANETNRTKLPRPNDEGGLAVLYGEMLRLLYRALFALFAEARGLVPIDLPLYRDNYALSSAHAAPRTGIAERVRALFALLRRGADLGGGEKIPAFGGALFAADAAPLVESLEWDDDAMAAVITKLTRVETPRGQIPVSYRELDEERLGSIYERLLELRLSVADRAMERIRVQGRELVVDPASLEDLAGYERETPQIRALAPLFALEHVAGQTEGTDVASTAFDADALESDVGGDDAVGYEVLESDAVDDDAFAEDADEIDADVDEASSDETTNGALASRNGTRGKRQISVVETIPAGTPYLASSSGRKETASYYTARDLVDFLVRETIDPQAERAEPATILKLRVVDPAMGSGHFLIGAMRRLADHLLAAYRRSEERDGFASLPPLVQHAWEDERELLTLCRQLVAVHCLYGVDKNPLAVDLARVALWLGTAAANHPLSFLDHRLRRGDSLLGLDVAQIVAVGAARKSKRNSRSETAAQYSMLSVGDELVDEIALEHAVQNRLVQAFRVLSGFLAIVDDEAEPFELKRERADAVRSVLEPLARLHAARVGRLLSADEDEGAFAFLAALRTFATFGYLVERDCAALETFVVRGQSEGAFCWPLEFPDAYYRARDDGSVVTREDAGFDVVLGNPPWDKLRLDKRQFYARFDPLMYLFEGRNAATRVLRINKGNNKAALVYESALSHYNSYAKALVQLEQFANQTVGADGKRLRTHHDYYKFFVELGWRRCCPKGAVGMVVPGGLTNSAGASGLRRLLLEESRLRSVVVFENRLKLFPIDSRKRFVAVSFQKTSPGLHFSTAFWQTTTDILRGPKAAMSSVSPIRLRKSDPRNLVIPEYRSSIDELIDARLCERFSPFAQRDEEWPVRIGSDIGLTKSSRNFRLKSELEAAGAIRTDDFVYMMDRDAYIPVYEGRLVQHFDLNAKGWLSGDGRSAVWQEHGWPKPMLSPHHWISKSALSETQQSFTDVSRFYWCEVTGATNERSAMGSIIASPAIAGNSIVRLDLDTRSPEMLATIACVFNSFVFDWMCRFRISEHLSFSYVASVPFVRTVPLGELVDKVAEVSSSGIRYEHRASSRAALDAATALAYELSYAEFAHILAAFPLLDRAEPPLEDELRSTITRDLALAEYCRLASEHDPEHADRVRAARERGALGYVATPLRAQLPNAHRRNPTLVTVAR